MSHACAHCGLPLSDTEGLAPADPGLHFCCRGCERVYALLHDAGLDAYYDLRSRYEGGRNGRPVMDAEASERFVHLDDPAVTERLGGTPGVAQLGVSGLQCPACVWLLERLPERVPGLLEARVDFPRSTVDLRWDPAELPLSRVAASFAAFGYELHAEDGEARAAEKAHARAELLRLAVTGACAGNVMLIAFALHAQRFAGTGGMSDSMRAFLQLIALLLTVPVVVYGAAPFHRAVVAGLRHDEVHLDLPISLGIVAAFVGSVAAFLASASRAWGWRVGEALPAWLGGDPDLTYFDSIAALVFLLLVGRWLQRRATRVADSQWSLLQGLLPETACRWDAAASAWTWTPSSRLEPGDRLRVRAGEAMPADGRVVVGRGMVDEAMLTGESRPRRLVLGSTVAGGTRLVEGELELVAEQTYAETRAGRLAATIAEAGHRRPGLVRYVDVWGRRFVAFVVVAALGAALLWAWLDPSRVFPVVLAVVVVACPCALGLATPMTLAVARGRAARRGVAIADGDTFARLARLRRIVFDKTGTLTEGRARVVTADARLDRWRPWIGAAEAEAEHPLALAVRHWASEGGEGEATTPGAPSQLEERPGDGVEAVWPGGPRLRIGAPRWLGVDDANPWLQGALEGGRSPVCVEVDGMFVGCLGVGDRPREGLERSLAKLRRLGLELAIASGDHPAAVARFAAAYGIEDPRGGMLPADKLELLANGTDCALVGDGINDAAAMRAATVGIAVGAAAEVARRVADVHLIRSDGLETLPELIAFARRVDATVRRNIRIAVAYNLVFGIAAVLGWVDPLVAAVIMPISSLSMVGLAHLGADFAVAGKKGTAPSREAQYLRGAPRPIGATKL